MRKQIKAYGNTSVIVFTKEDLKGYGWKIGDIIDISDASKIQEMMEGKENDN